MSRQIDWDHENMIEEAIAAAEHTTVSAAARNYGLSRSTLQSRIDGAVNIHIAKEESQRLSHGEERQLVDWILHEEAAGRAPSHAQIQGFAQLMASISGDRDPIGHNWVPRFIDRHEDLKTKGSRSVEAA